MEPDKNTIHMLLERIQFVCSFCSNYDVGPSVIVSNPLAQEAKTALEDISKRLAELLGTETGYSLAVSKGSGSFPRVPWIGISPLGKRVSNSLSVVTCFARNGAGIVTGLMAPAEVTLRAQVQMRSLLKDYLNIDGVSSTTRYNDKFINPKDFKIAELDIDDYLDHLNKSLELMKHLQATD